MYRKVKRLFDVTLSLMLLPLVVLVSAAAGLLIILEDGFPIFYNAPRRGEKGSVFSMYKLRSMKNASPDLRNEDGSTFNGDNDPRVTSIGKKLRKYSIDELPQIFNVLKGDMSFVGPRPSLVSKPYEELNRWQKMRLEMQPGITGFNQAYFRNAVSAEKKIRNDCWYVKHACLRLDINILVVTFVNVFKQKNVFQSNK